MATQKEINTMFVDPFQVLDMPALVGEAMEDNAPRILAVNKRQLSAGLDSAGKSLGRYKNFKYKDRYQPVDLYRTGDFWNKFTLTAGKKFAEIFSQDQKAPMLEKRYGKEIFGIDAQNRDTVEDIIFTPLGKLIKNKLFNL